MLETGQYLQQGRYRIKEHLNQGGMGTVYLATDRNLLQRLVAIKENRDTFLEAQEQFQEEAVMLARLSHPNLPRVTDHFIEPPGRQYLVMDYVSGDDLQEILRKRGEPLPEAEALAWMGQVMDALEYMHSLVDDETGQPRPIIHRDIKPSNIKRTADGRIVLVDFGLAKYQTDMGTQIGAKGMSSGYSPIEQYTGGGTDVRSDIYALGATLYFLLTGTKPPDSPAIAGGKRLIAPRKLNPKLSYSTERVILHAMQIRATDRFRNIEELRAALGSGRLFGFGTDRPTTPPTRRLAANIGNQSRRLPSVWSWIGIVALIVLIGFLISSGLALPRVLPWLFPTVTPAAGLAGLTTTATNTPPVTLTMTATMSSSAQAAIPITLTAAVTATQIAMITPTATSVAIPISTTSPTLSPTLTASSTPVPTTPAPTQLPTNTATATVRPTATIDRKATETTEAIQQQTVVAAAAPTQPPTATWTPTARPTPTALPTASPTLTAVPTSLPTATSTTIPTPVPTPSATDTPIPTATRTATATVTPLPTATSTWTSIPTATPTVLPTATATPLPTATATATTPPPTATSIPDTPTPSTPTAGATRVNAKDNAVYVFVPAGPFTMGSTAAPAEMPEHVVDLDDFWIMQTEVTNAEYAGCVAAGACQESANPERNNQTYAQHPVTYVNWDQANQYAAWAGGRLPTEAEWEKAGAGTDLRIYPWGNTPISDQLLNANNTKGVTTLVGSYPAGASPYGALDMAGNVEEWVTDWYSATYYATSPAQNPLGPDTGTNSRVTRGGSFSTKRIDIRTTARSKTLFKGRGFPYVGFRVVVPKL